MAYMFDVVFYFFELRLLSFKNTLHCLIIYTHQQEKTKIDFRCNRINRK